MLEVPLYILLVAIAIMSIIGFVVMAYDKRQAVNGEWRVRNDCNYFLAIFFGAPGVLLAMVVCRHKIRQWRYWVMVVVGLIVDICLLIAFLVSN